MTPLPSVSCTNAYKLYKEKCNSFSPSDAYARELIINACKYADLYNCVDIEDELYYNPEKVIIFLSFIEGAEYLKENLTNLLII